VGEEIFMFVVPWHSLRRGYTISVPFISKTSTLE